METLERRNAFDGNLVFGAELFNKLTNRDKHRELRLKEAEKHVDPSTGLIKAELAVERNCPLCGSDDYEVLFVKEGAPHVACNSCTMVYTQLMLNSEALDEYYRNETSYTNILLNTTQLDLDRKKFKYGLDLIEEQCSGTSTVLDIGCGPGIFLEIAREAGWSTMGLEFNEACIKRLEENDIPVSNEPLNDYVASGKHVGKNIKVVTLWTVLEHVDDPLGMIKDVNRLLPDDGIVFIVVPNINSLANRLMHEKSSTFSVTHLNLFGPETMRKLLNLGGFETVNLETHLTLQSVVKSHLNYKSELIAKSPVEEMFNFLSPKFIHDQLMGYCLLAVGKKKKNI